MNTHTTNKNGRNVSHTQIMSWAMLQHSGEVVGEEATALSYIKAKGLVTSRLLTEQCGKERCHWTRVLHNLVKAGKLEIAKIAPCPTTGRKVQWYGLKGSKVESEQPKLFKQ